MRENLFATLARRAVIAVVSAIALAAVAGGTFVAASRPDTPPGLANKPEAATEVEAQTEHGGDVARFHGGLTAGVEDSCDLPPGVTLEGNWTHGDYVSAWSHEGTQEEQNTAAQSPCGKPVDSLEEATATTQGKSDEPHGKSDEPHGGGAEVSAEHRNQVATEATGS